MIWNRLMRDTIKEFALRMVLYYDTSDDNPIESEVNDRAKILYNLRCSMHLVGTIARRVYNIPYRQLKTDKEPYYRAYIKISKYYEKYVRHYFRTLNIYNHVPYLDISTICDKIIIYGKSMLEAILVLYRERNTEGRLMSDVYLYEFAHTLSGRFTGSDINDIINAKLPPYCVDDEQKDDD